MNSTSRSYYEILGVSQDATLEDLRAAHRHLAFLLHPDRQAGFSESEKRLAERRIREVNEAWTILSDSESRAEYDRLLQNPTAGASEESPPAAGSTSSPRGVHFDDVESSEASHHYQRRFAHDDGSAADGVLYDSFGDSDDPDNRAHRSLLSGGLILAVLGVALAIFVFTAYAGSGRDNGTVPKSVKSDGTGECAKKTAEASTAARVTCSEPNDGRIVSEPAMGSDCPAGTEALLIDKKVACVEPAVPTKVLSSDAVNGD